MLNTNSWYIHYANWRSSMLKEKRSYVCKLELNEESRSCQDYEIIKVGWRYELIIFAILFIHASQLVGFYN